MKKVAVLLSLLLAALNSLGQNKQQILSNYEDEKNYPNILVGEVLRVRPEAGDFREGTYDIKLAIPDTLWLVKKRKPGVEYRYGRHYTLNWKYKTVPGKMHWRSDGKEFAMNEYTPWDAIKDKHFKVLSFNKKPNYNLYEAVALCLEDGATVAFDSGANFLYVERFEELFEQYYPRGEKYYLGTKDFVSTGVRMKLSFWKIARFYLMPDVGEEAMWEFCKNENEHQEKFQKIEEAAKIKAHNDTIKKAKEGAFQLELYKVEKPSNSQIKFGKTTTVSESGLSKYKYEDNYLSIIWLASNKDFGFSLSNKTNYSIKIIWDDAVYVDERGRAGRTFHSGVKYSERTNSQPATVVPKGCSYDDLLAPTDNVFSTDSGWGQENLLNGGYEIEGKTVKILLPIEIQGIENEYTFHFKIKWTPKYPELKEYASLPLLQEIDVNSLF